MCTGCVVGYTTHQEHSTHALTANTGVCYVFLFSWGGKVAFSWVCAFPFAHTQRQGFRRVDQCGHWVMVCQLSDGIPQRSHAGPVVRRTLNPVTSAVVTEFSSSTRVQVHIVSWTAQAANRAIAMFDLMSPLTKDSKSTLRHQFGC